MVCIYILHIGREEKNRIRNHISLDELLRKKNEYSLQTALFATPKDKKRRISARVLLVLASVDVHRCITVG